MSVITAIYCHCSNFIINICFVFCFFGLVTLFQVINFNTICLQNEVMYECIEDQDRLLTWDVRQSSSSAISTFTASYGVICSTANYTKTIGSSTISVQLIYRNSTFISSVMTITNATNLRDFIIECNGEIESLRDSIQYTGILGRINFCSE